MATELGVAYLSIIADTGKLKNSVRDAFSGMDGEASKVGEKIGSTLGSKIKAGLKIGATALAGLGALVGGLAIKGGIDRALKIDTAQAKLRGLGHDADSVQSIMKNALASVKGTAFGLGEAATVAAGAVAAGIQPGERLEGVLKSVANSAAAAGVPMDEMGAIFNKVASLGKAQNDVLQQVADKGIPIYQALGEQMGMTADEVFDAASKGKISFEDFEAAMRKASGTVAQEMGTTLPGKFANFKAALSRLGESLVSKLLPHIGDAFSFLTDKADELSPVAKQIGAALGEALGAFGDFIQQTVIPAVQEAATWFNESLIPALQATVTWVQENTTWLGPLAAAVIGGMVGWYGYAAALAAVKLVSGGFSSIAGNVIGAIQGINAAFAANPIGVVIALIAALVAGLVWFFTQTELGQQIWATVWQGIQDIAAGVVAWWSSSVAPTFQAVWDAITAGIQVVAGVFAAAWQGIQDGASVAGSVLAGVWDAIGVGIQAVAAVFAVAWQGIQDGARVAGEVLAGVWAGILVAAQPVISWFGEHVSPVFQALGELIQAVVTEIIMPAIGGLILIWQSLGDLIQAVWVSLIKPAIDGVAVAWQSLGPIFQSVWDSYLKPVADAVGSLFQALWVSLIKPAIDGIVVGWQALGVLFQAVWDGILKPVLDGIGVAFQVLWAAAIKPVLDAISAAWNVLWAGIQLAWNAVGVVVVAAISAAFNGMVAVISGALQAIWAVVTTIFDAIRITVETALALITNIIRAVTAVIKGDWEGVWNAISAFFMSIWNGMIEFITAILNGLLGFLSGVWAAISGAWNALWSGIQAVGLAAWNWINETASGIFRSLSATLDGVWQGISKAWNDFWSGVKTAGQGAWDWINTTATGVFNSMKGTVEATWNAMANAIGDAWKKIKEFVASPINAVINFINVGIIDTYNWVADKIKIVPQISGKIPTLQFARGGILPGQSSWRDGDDQLTWMRRGEGVTVSEALRDPYERKRLLALNKATMSGMSPAQFRRKFDPGLEAHATGGIISFRGHRFTQLFAANIEKAESLAGSRMHITQGGWRPRTSYSGTSHAGDALDITGDYRRFIVPLRRVGIPTWDRAGKGNWVAHAHGVPLPSAGTAAGSAVWQAQDYLRGGDGLGGRDNGPRVGADSGTSAASYQGIQNGGDPAWWESAAKWIGDTWEAVKSWFKDMLDKIAGPFKKLGELVNGKGPFGDIAKNLGEKLKKDMSNWVREKIGLPKEEGYRRGTRHAAPGWAWVGEEGPELVNFGGGEQVIPAAESARLARGDKGMNVYLSMPKDAFETAEQLFEFMSDLPGQVRRMGGVMV